jgi:hypothetical protein
MTEQAVILEGVESEASKAALYSTVHGAGRVMGRMEAKGTFDRKTGAVKRPGKITQEMSLHSAISVCRKYWQRTPVAYGCCTHSRRWVSRWLQQQSLIPSRTEDVKVRNEKAARVGGFFVYREDSKEVAEERTSHFLL